MAVTTTPDLRPDTTGAPLDDRRGRGIVAAVAVAAGLLGAVALLVAVVLGGDRSDPAPATVAAPTEQGTIAALDHQADALAARAGSPAAVAADRGSIAAIDRRAALRPAPATPADLTETTGSITALDHDADAQQP